MAPRREDVRRYLESMRPLLNSSQVAASSYQGSRYNQLMGNYINPAQVIVFRLSVWGGREGKGAESSHLYTWALRCRLALSLKTGAIMRQWREVCTHTDTKTTTESGWTDKKNPNQNLFEYSNTFIGSWFVWKNSEQYRKPVSNLETEVD